MMCPPPPPDGLQGLCSVLVENMKLAEPIVDLLLSQVSL